jgi:ketosteroid isomerase-like protein
VVGRTCYSWDMPRMRDTRLRTTLLGALFLLAALGAACAGRDDAPSSVERAAIADTLKRLVATAYDLADTTGGGPFARIMRLYPDTGAVVSAAGGRLTTTRAGLEREIRAFYENVGRNMVGPKWTWGETHVDVLARDAAVLTATYSIPHLTPMGRSHVVGGAWTAVFARRGGRWMIVQEHLSDVPQQR